jgi:anaerobic selenocysteine-containing dehydrogenase
LFDQVLRTACTVCPIGCGVLACLRGSRVVILRGDPDHPVNQGRVCLKCIASLNALNDPERILFPMKRTGGRGQSRWKRISWDEALSETAVEMARLRAQNKAGAIVIQDGSAAGDAGLRARFCDATGATTSTPLAPVPLLPDLGKAKTLINLCGDLLEGESGPLAADRVLDFVFRRGGTLVTFDPVLTTTASRSQHWFPIEPGKEAALLEALGAMHRARRQGTKPEALPQDAALGLPAGTLARLWELAGSGKTALVVGQRALYTPQGGEVSRLLAAPGPGTGYVFPGFSGLSKPSPAPPLRSQRGDVRRLLSEGKAKALLLSRSDPAADTPGCDETAGWLADEARVPFLAVHDTHWTRTARLADLVLPAAAPFEVWGVQEGREALTLVRPVSRIGGEFPALRSARARGRKFSEIRSFARPPGQAKPLGDLLLDLGRRMGEGVGRHLDFPDTEAFVREALRESLKEKALDELGERGFTTAETPEGVTLPEGPVDGAGPGPRAQDKNTFLLVALRTPLDLPGLGNSKWLREMEHDNPLLVNRSAGRALGLGTGDRVRLSSRAGKALVRVRLLEGIHPSAVALLPGFGSDIQTRTARGDRFPSSDPDTSRVWWDGFGPGVNVNKILEPADAAFPGTYARGGTVVRIDRV